MTKLLTEPGFILDEVCFGRSVIAATNRHSNAPVSDGDHPLAVVAPHEGRVARVVVQGGRQIYSSASIYLVLEFGRCLYEIVAWVRIGRIYTTY